MKQYYISRLNGQQQGPLDELFVREEYAAGSYEDGTQVWTDGMPDYAPINTVFPDVNKALAEAPRLSSSPKQYHVATPDGRQYGPLDEALVREQYAAGTYTDEAMVWAVGLPSWVPIATVFPAEKPAMPQPPPFQAKPMQPPPAPLSTPAPSSSRSFTSDSGASVSQEYSPTCTPTGKEHSFNTYREQVVISLVVSLLFILPLPLSLVALFQSFKASHLRKKGVPGYEQAAAAANMWSKASFVTSGIFILLMLLGLMSENS